MAAAVQIGATDDTPPAKRRRGRATPRAEASTSAALVALELNAPTGASTPTTRRPRRGRAASQTGDAPAQPKPRRTRAASSSAGGRKRSGQGARTSIQTLAGDGRAWASLARIRRALLDLTLDDALRVTVETLVETFAPAAARVWVADQAPWMSELSRAGGQELFPTMRLRAAAGPSALPDAGAESGPGSVIAPEAADLHAHLARLDAIVDDVAATRRALVLADAASHPLAESWLASAGTGLPGVATLAAYPLQARGQFLGVLVVGTARALGPDGLASLEAVADLCAVAAEHDRLLSYSHGQEALAQTVVRHAPVAVAVLTGREYIFVLANPAFAQLLGAENGLRGRRLADVVEGAARLRDGFRLDAVYTTGEPQAMVELPIHLDRGLTYWNVTSSPLPGRFTRVGGVLVAAVDVTRQVMERQRALEAAEVAQERIGQMMALHATSLAVSSQLGADPRELLADILRRSIALLNARAGTVYVADWRVGELEVIVCQGLRGDYVGSRIRIGQGLAGQVARTSQGLLVDDIRLFPTSPAIYAGEAVSAVIAVPLIHHGCVVGVLDVLDDADRRTFTQDDLWLLDLFAAQAAQAIENARNYVELERAYRVQRELDRMKDDFIATASHELRTPLTGVQGFLDLLLEYPGSRDEPLALEFLIKASESAAELAELTERLLQTSRLDTGRLELHLETVRLRELVDEVVRAQSDRLAMQSSQHALMVDVPDEVCVRADPTRLKEVLDNVVGNAIKYSPRGGTVRIGCGADVGPRAPDTDASGIWRRERQGARAGGDAMGDQAETTDLTPMEFGGDTVPLVMAGRGPLSAAAAALADRPTAQMPVLAGAGAAEPEDAGARVHAPGTRLGDEGFVTITVSDQGMGIPPDERERLFGRFVRLDAARSSQIRGTGLGLYICRQLMEAMGGAIWLHDSAPERGSTFALALPLARHPFP